MIKNFKDSQRKKYSKLQKATPLFQNLKFITPKLVLPTNVYSLLKKCKLVTQSRLSLYKPMDGSPPGSSVHGNLQEGILEWVSISFSSGSPPPRDWTSVSCIAGIFFSVWATRETHCIHYWAPCQMSPFPMEASSQISQRVGLKALISLPSISLSHCLDSEVFKSTTKYLASSTDSGPHSSQSISLW